MKSERAGPISIAECRKALGKEARGKTDAEIESIRARMYELAQTIAAVVIAKHGRERLHCGGGNWRLTASDKKRLERERMRWRIKRKARGR
jgi:hypothetical protein